MEGAACPTLWSPTWWMAFADNLSPSDYLSQQHLITPKMTRDLSMREMLRPSTGSKLKLQDVGERALLHRSSSCDGGPWMNPSCVISECFVSWYVSSSSADICEWSLISRQTIPPSLTIQTNHLPRGRLCHWFIHFKRQSNLKSVLDTVHCTQLLTYISPINNSHITYQSSPIIYVQYLHKYTWRVNCSVNTDTHLSCG